MVFRRLVCLFSLPCLLFLSLLSPATTSAMRQATSASSESALANASSEAVQAEPATEISKIGKKLKQAFPDDSALANALLKEAKREKSDALITNDAVIFGILALMRGFVFYLSLIHI